MEIFSASLSEHLRAFVTSLAIGLLIGLERERKPDAKAGLRTYALVALLGTLAAMLGQETGSGWMLAAGMLVIGAMMMLALTVDPQQEHDPGTTSVIALMTCYALGATVWFGYETLAVMLAIVTTALLYFKAELHGFSRSLTAKDLISILQFAVLSFVILPILPDQNFGPYGALNPHQIWWMVVLISGVSLAGYTALRIVGPRHGPALIGFFGGLVSSTATTMVFARNAKSIPDMTRTAAVVILIASLMVMLRLALFSGVVATALVLPLGMVLGTGLVAGVGITLLSWRGLSRQGEMPMPEVANPTEIRAALTFGLIYGLVLLLSAWLQDIAGARGLYAVALASGLTDVDAITLSTLRMFNLGKLGETQAVIAIALAVVSNICFKAGLALSIGGATLGRHALPGLAAIAIGIGIGMALTFFS
ncbi:MgtC/SapB family protein [Georgfuchsia toluolica]|nr:MgtC/SapB family protein [Georgfuchsia toluolica]